MPVTDDDGNPLDGTFTATLNQDDTYFVDIRGNDGAGVQAFYIADVTVTDPEPPVIQNVTRLPLPGPGSTSYSEGILADNPSVYFRLNETTGTVIADSSGHAGGPHHGTVTGSPTFDQTGPFGESGDSAIQIGADSHIEIPDGDRIDNRRTIAFSFWMNANSFANSWMPILFKGTTSSSQRSYALWLNNNGYFQFGTSDNSGQQSYNTSSGLIAPNSWNHIAGSINRDTGRIKLWVNGVERIDQSIRTGDIRDNANSLRVGWTHESSNSYSRFDGRIDELAIWTEPKNGNELLAPYFDSKWKGEERSTETLISTFAFDVNERLIGRSVNYQNWDMATHGGHTYIKLSSRTWENAQAWANANGGYIAVPDTQQENDFIWQRFSDPPNHDLWIGLSDESTQIAGASEGNWKTLFGNDPLYTNWAGSEPNSGDGYDFAYLHYNNGLWYDGWQTWNQYSVIEFDSDVDTDGDGLPDVIDRMPNDALNGLEIRSAGPDDTFGTADDVVYDARASYDGNTRVNVTIADGPLYPGRYRLTVTDTITDLVGNALDGDRNGTIGGDFVQFFSVDRRPGFIYENPLNSSLAGATELLLVEQPEGSGHFYTEVRGLGSQDPANYQNTWSDVDYWKFDALAGDRVSIAVDTPHSGVDPYIELRNSANNTLGGSTPDSATDDNAGPGSDAYISHYTISADGTYYVRVGKNYWSRGIGNYEIRLQVGRGIDLESDAEYHNDSTANADALTFSPSGNQRTATAAGTIMAGQSGNVDEDYFSLGVVEAGETVFSRVTLPAGSELIPVIEIRNASNQIVSINPNPTDASIARYDINQTGTYFVVILGQGGQGPDARYLLDSTIGPTSELQFADLSVSNIGLPIPPTATAGETMTVTWTVENFGTATTDKSEWFDRVVLSRDPVLGGLDDQDIASVRHVGALAVGEGYSGTADVTLPLDSDGTYYVIIETDERGDVFEFTLTDNNVTVSEPLTVNPRPLPDFGSRKSCVDRTGRQWNLQCVLGHIQYWNGPCDWGIH